MPMAYGTAAILVMLILIINISAYLIMRYFYEKIFISEMRASDHRLRLKCLA